MQMPCPACLTKLQCIVVQRMAPGYSLERTQLDDQALGKIIEMKLSSFPKLPYFVWSSDPVLRFYWHCWNELFITNGMLLKYLTVDKCYPNYAFVISTHMIDSVLTGIHSSPFSGHLGIRRTVLRVRSRFYWPHMVKHIIDFVRNCRLCAQNKLDPNHNKAPLQSIEVSEPFFSGPWITRAHYPRPPWEQTPPCCHRSLCQVV